MLFTMLLLWNLEPCFLDCCPASIELARRSTGSVGFMQVLSCPSIVVSLGLLCEKHLDSDLGVRKVGFLNRPWRKSGKLQWSIKQAHKCTASCYFSLTCFIWIVCSKWLHRKSTWQWTVEPHWSFAEWFQMSCDGQYCLGTNWQTQLFMFACWKCGKRSVGWKLMLNCINNDPAYLFLSR